MTRKCDLYICESVKNDRLRFIGLFDYTFRYQEESAYVGFLGVGIGRIKAVSIVSDLRGHGVSCFSVPIEYRDAAHWSVEMALDKAESHAESIKASIAPVEKMSQRYPPLYWMFHLLNNEGEGGRSGGVVMVDRIDGHIWSKSEYEEYMYDYNNII